VPYIDGAIMGEDRFDFYCTEEAINTIIFTVVNIERKNGSFGGYIAVSEKGVRNVVHGLN
jgi:hypothetical protein